MLNNDLDPYEVEKYLDLMKEMKANDVYILNNKPYLNFFMPYDDFNKREDFQILDILKFINENNEGK